VLDRTNVRHLTADDIGGAVELTVADLSFISLRLVLPALADCTLTDGEMLVLVKPQFEVGKDALGAGGVVRSPELRATAVRDVAAAAAGVGVGARGVVASPLPGPAGNVEYILRLARDAGELTDAAIEAAVLAGPQ
jgi:23S rRNA (cytidine1920-2'-O)/16S rRNA (cytidine1409-2'-O)-methyltransferase